MWGAAVVNDSLSGLRPGHSGPSSPAQVFRERTALVRRTRSGSRCRPPGGLPFLPILALVVASITSATTQAQTPKAPAAPDTRPLARFIARDELFFYIGSDGLDAQAEAWKKTAAYKLLNETNLGVMLEDMVSQFAESRLAQNPNRKLSGADVLTIIKATAKAGFVIASNTDKSVPAGTPGSEHMTIVLRGAAARDVRGAYSRMLGTIWGANTPKQIKKGNRAVIVVPMTGKSKDDHWSWWSEGNDLFIAVGKGADDALIATMEGKKPNALENPARAELSRAEGGFIPVGQMFFDITAMPKAPSDDPRAAKALGTLTASGLTRIDYRWGFQDDALMTVTRLKAPKPRRGWLALFDQPVFDKGLLPPLPEGIESFTVFGADMDTTYDQLLTSSDPQAKARLTQMADTIKSRARVDLRKDLLARLGTKFAFYVMPGGTAAVPPVAVAPAVGPGGVVNPLASLLGLRQVPRFTLAAEVDDNSAFGKTLDSLMIALNKEIRERIYAAAENAPKPPPTAPGSGSRDEEKGRREPPPVPEFRPTPSNNPSEKSYVLYIPPALSKQFPTGFRPTIRLLNKQLVFATTPDAARQALEVKAGVWTPPADLAPAFDQLPKELVVLGARDPRTALPEILAGLPGSFQKAFNSLAMLMPAPPPAVPGAAPGAAPAGAAAAGPAGAMPGAPGTAPAHAPFVVFSIPESRLPKAEEIRERLFPGSFAVSTDEQEVRFVSRKAFPHLPDPSSLTGVAVALPAILAAQQQAAAAAAAEAAPKTKSAKPGTPSAASKKGAGFVPKD